MDPTRWSDYTQDGTVDLRGNPVRRSQRGGWKACSFIVVYEVFERMAFYAVSTNLFLYLTMRLHQGTVKSANDVTNWVGTIWMTPALGAYIADAYLGRYWTFVIASIIYLSGMLLLTLSVSLPALKPPSCQDVDVEKCTKASILQIGVFYAALYILAVGTGGSKANISTIGADQFDDFDPKEKSLKLSFFNWWMFSIFFGSFVANTTIVYVQDNLGWTIGYGLPTVGLLASIIFFLFGTPFYRHRLPTGSPFGRMARVIVASLRKCNVAVPNNSEELHEVDMEEYTRKGHFRIKSTPSLRLLNKAAVDTGSRDAWMLCTVTQVEETKQMLRMIPILVTTFIPSAMIAQINTLFVKQCTTLDRRIGNFEMPAASLSGFVTISMLVSVVVYDRFFIKITKRWTRNPRGITLLQRMGTGLVFHIIIMAIAYLTERHRLRMARKYGVVEIGKEIPVTVFILLPQFLLMGTADAFLEVAKIEFFYDQAPESMKSLGTSYSTTTLGIGNFISSFFLSSVSLITNDTGHGTWISDNLNASHLDYYYAFFAILNLFNFLVFLIVIRSYVYKTEVSKTMEVLARELGGIKLGSPTEEFLPSV